jgi:hypothetical protein
MVLLIVTPGVLSRGQMSSDRQMQQAPQNPGMPPMDGRHAPGDGDALPPDLTARQERSRNVDRQKQLVADTTRLLILATDLKTEVDKTNKDVLSVDVIKKADEIEKLARSVKDRMKG